MKQFVYYILLVSAIVFTADILVSASLDHLYLKTRTGQTGGKINYYLHLPKPPQLLIMGNSRAFYQIIPDSFHIPAFNIGHAGTDDGFEAALLDLLEKEHKLPEIILLQVDPSFYRGATPQDDVNSTSVNVLQYYYGTNETITNYINQISPSQRFFFLFRSYRYNNRLINIINNYYKTAESKIDNQTGYEAIPYDKPDSINTINSLSKALFPPFVFAPNKMKYLKEIISVCKSHGTRLVLFSSPNFDDRMSAYLRPLSQKIDSLTRANNITYINYLEIKLPLITNNGGYWKDSEHLNHRGAQIQSHDLARILNQSLEGRP
jgi:hypothetical protein